MESLEQACIALSHGNNQDRRKADEFLRTFRRSETPYDLCNQILQQSSNMNAKYEALATIRNALLREWPSLDIQWTEAFRTHLLEYTINQINKPSYILNQLVLVIALMFKRGWIGQEANSSQVLLTQLDTLLQSSLKHEHIGLVVASAIVSEFNITLNSGSDLGVPWTYHVECHISFEQILLPELLKRTIATIEKYRTQDNNDSISHSLQLLESILCWEYVDTTDASSLLLRVMSRSSDETDTSAEGSVFVEPGQRFSELLVTSSLVEVLSTCYQQIGYREDISTLKFCRSCLIQLMSVRGKVFRSLNEQNNYMTKLWKSLAVTLQTITVNILPNKNNQDDSKIYKYHDLIMGASQMYNRLLSTYSFRDLIALLLADAETLKIFIACLNMIASITLNLLPIGLLNVGDVETWQNESLDASLAFWVRLSSLFESLSLRDLKNVPEKMLIQFKMSCNEIFNVFVQNQLTAAFKIALDNIENLEAQEQFKESIHDMDRLLDIGHIGRINALNSISLINNLIQQRSNQLMSAASNQVIMNSNEIIAIHEELYWLFHILGEVLTDSSEGEIPLIPRECLKVSLKHSQNLSNKQIDPIGHSADCVLAHCELESQVLRDKGYGILLSPLVAESAIWFLKRWCSSYLMPQAALYDLLSPSLWNTIGPGTEYAKHLLAKITEKLVINLVYWNNEQKLSEFSCELFLCLADNARIRKFLHGLSSYQTLLQAYINDDKMVMKLSSVSLQKLIRGFCQTAIPNSFEGMTNNERESSRCEFFIILESLERRIHNVVGTANFEKIVHLYECKREVHLILDIMTGIGTSTGSDCFQLAFEFSLKYLPYCIKLIQFFSKEDSTIISNVLKLFLCLACGEIEYIPIQMYQQFMVQCHNVIDEFVLHNMQRLQDFRKLGEKLQSMKAQRDHIYRDGVISKIESESEDQYVDITTLLNLFRQLADKINPLNGTSDTSIQVVLHGIRNILPALNENVLLFPDVCKAYFQLIEEIATNHGEHFIKLQSNTLNAIIQSLMYALNHHVEEIAYMGIQTLSEITSYQYRADMNGTSGPWASVMCDLVVTLLEHILVHQIRFRLINVMADALLPAIQWVNKAQQAHSCINSLLNKIPSNYHNLMNNLVAEMFQLSIQLEEKKKERSSFRKIVREAAHRAQSLINVK